MRFLVEYDVLIEDVSVLIQKEQTVQGFTDEASQNVQRSMNPGQRLSQCSGTVENGRCWAKTADVRVKTADVKTADVGSKRPMFVAKRPMFESNWPIKHRLLLRPKPADV